MSSNLTFRQLREANEKRSTVSKYAVCENDWTIGDWMMALVGEVGELANFLKKWRRGDCTFQEIREKVEKEFGDIQTYLDIVALRLGIDLGQVTINKFNEVSHRIGCDVLLPGKPEPSTSEIQERMSVNDILVKVRELSPGNKIADFKPDLEVLIYYKNGDDLYCGRSTGRYSEHKNRVMAMEDLLSKIKTGIKETVVPPEFSEETDLNHVFVSGVAFKDLPDEIKGEVREIENQVRDGNFMPISFNDGQGRIPILDDQVSVPNTKAIRDSLDNGTWSGAKFLIEGLLDYIKALEDTVHHYYDPSIDRETSPLYVDKHYVDSFASIMAHKMANSVLKGRHGWDNPDLCKFEDLAHMLINHLTKGNDGNYVDVANFCMMLHHRGASPHVLKDAYLNRLRAHDEAVSSSTEGELERLRKTVSELRAELDSVSPALRFPLNLATPVAELVEDTYPPVRFRATGEAFHSLPPGTKFFTNHQVFPLTDILRSVISIGKRNGKDTNWEALIKRVYEVTGWEESGKDDA